MPSKNKEGELFSENRAIYEIMWKNIVKPGRPQMIIQRMWIACWITKVTDTHSAHVILIAFPLQQWLYECASMLCRTYIVCLVLILWKYFLFAPMPSKCTNYMAFLRLGLPLLQSTHGSSKYSLSSVFLNIFMHVLFPSYPLCAPPISPLFM